MKSPTPTRPTAGKPTPGKPTLGRLLRGLRMRNDWTLKEMSQRTGIPLSTLAKVEHDRLTLTYDKLQQLSERLKIRMSELFAEPAEGPDAAVTARRSIGRINRAVRINTPNYDYYYLCAELRRKRMIPVLTRIRAKSVGEFGELCTTQARNTSMSWRGGWRFTRNSTIRWCLKPANPFISTPTWATHTWPRKGATKRE